MQVKDKILELRVDRENGIASVVAVGEIDYSSVPAFREALRDAVSLKEPLIRVDLTDVTYLDSSGIYALLEAWRDQGGRPSGVSLRLGKNTAATAIRLAGLDSVMELEDQVPWARTVEETRVEPGGRQSVSVHGW